MMKNHQNKHKYYKFEENKYWIVVNDMLLLIMLNNNEGMVTLFSKNILFFIFYNIVLKI